jgi:hypothetical protein
MSSSARALGVTFAFSTAVAIAIACGSETGDDGSSGSNGSSGETSSGFGSSGTSSGASSGASGDGAPCFAPVDMYVMFDRSGSMGNDGNIGTVNSKWTRAVTALSGYLNSMQAKDQAAAIQFFPLDTHSGGLCTTGDSYNVGALPATSYTTLPSNSFDALLNSESPSNNGGTPTEAAIRGLTRFTAANRRGGRVTIGILITDGNPNGCDEDRGNLSNLLQAHFAATQIRTYVIGMTGASFDNLEEIAQGGNAPPHPATVGTLTNACGGEPAPCRFWNVGDGDPAGFIAALAAIQQSADGCGDGGGFVNPVN